MKSSMGGMVRDIVCDENAKTALMTFNKDLSTTDLPKTESVIDKNITNPEDCQKAGKTWCVETSSGNGQCSNSTDCCRGVSAPTCRDCTPGIGTYSFTNPFPLVGCDSDGDGIDDGQCYPEGEDTMIYTCQQTQNICSSDSSCCLNTDLLIMMIQGVSIPFGFTLDEFLEMYQISKTTVAKYLNKAQCNSCDPENGQMTPIENGIECGSISYNPHVDKFFIDISECLNGQCKLVDVSLGNECTSYANCDSGEYCQFFEKTVPTDPKPEKGYCLPLSNWKESTTFQKFTMYETLSSSSASDWWTSSDICLAMGKRLATGEELGCSYNSNDRIYFCDVVQEWFDTTGVWLSSYMDAPYKTDYKDQNGAFLAIYYDNKAVLFSDVDFDGGPNDNLRVICADK
jgi:hypothetical protein